MKRAMTIQTGQSKAIVNKFHVQLFTVDTT